MRFLSATLIILSLSFFSCATPPKAVNAEKYGINAPKIWMPLTQAEVDVLNQASAGLNEEVRFKLALFFTGDTREKEEVEACFNNYKDFASRCDKELSGIADVKEKGKKLHELCFKEFIIKPRAEGYQSSGTAGLILKKEYDSNTATLLFSILSERYGFIPEILLTDGDIETITSKRTNLSMKVISGRLYLSLKHPELSEPVKIFTVWKDGYDLKIDMDFFNELQKNNPGTVKSADIEFKRYNKGEKVSLNEALLFQYKIDKAYEVVDLEFAPGYRRTEMAATLTDSCEILIDRTWVWRNIYSFLHDKWKNGELMPFIELIQNELERTRSLCEKEPGFIEIAGSLYLYSAFEYANAVNGAKMKETIRNAYKYIDTASKDYKNEKSWLVGSVHDYLNNVIKTNVIDAEVDNVNEIIESIPEHSTKVEVAASFYYHAGQYYFEKNDFWKAGQFFSNCTGVGENEYKKTCEPNGAVSFYNYAVNMLNENNCTKAKNGKDKCFEKFPGADSCNKTKELVEANCK